MSNVQNKIDRRGLFLLIIHQIISPFGNGLLRFALPLYVLEISGNAALFGLASGVPFISLIVMAPVGGIISDRLRKQRIMLWLDLITSGIVVIYTVYSGLFTGMIPIAILTLLAINAIQGLHSPTVDSSVPLLTSSDKLVRVNAVLTLFSSLSNIASPAIAGVLFAIAGLLPVLTITALCFVIVTVIDLFMRIPYNRQKEVGNISQTVVGDIACAFRFVAKEKIIFFKCAIVFFLLNLSLRGMIAVGFQVIVTQYFNMNMNMVGIGSSIIMVGGLLGSIISGTLGSKLTINRVYIPLIVCGISIVPVGLVLLLNTTVTIAFIVIVIVCGVAVAAGQLFFISTWTFIQRESPSEITGKILSFITASQFLGNGLGRLLAGIMFERFAQLPWIVFLTTAIVTIAVAAYSRHSFKMSAPSRSKEIAIWLNDVYEAGNYTMRSNARVRSF